MTTHYENGNLVVDTLDAENGHFQARLKKPSAKRQKIRIVKDGSLLTFDLKNDGNSETYPLQNGDGSYLVRLYENVTGNKYLFKGSVLFPVTLSRPDAAQLTANQYVNYRSDSEFIRTADELCFGRKAEEAYSLICNYISSRFRYDYVRALTVKPGMLPDLDRTWTKKMGICQDLAALTVVMLRSQGIPSKLAIGWADGQYHAWVTANTDGISRLYDPTAEVTSKKKVKNYTVERWY